MANITANSTDAFVSYAGNWSDIDMGMRQISGSGSSVSLTFTGTSFRAFGQYDTSASKTTCLINNELCLIKTKNVTNQPFLVTKNLTNQTHNFILTVNSGTVNLSHFKWDDPAASSEQQQNITGALSEGWSHDEPPNFTTAQGSNITFTFHGTGIAVMGWAGPEQGTFSAKLDDLEPRTRNASALTERLVVLHRDDGLSDKTHTLTLTNLEPKRLQVGEAQIFGESSDSYQPTPTPTSPPPCTTSTPSNTGTRISRGSIAGIVIGMFAFLGILGFALYWYRRRRTSQNVYARNEIIYARMCSKCRKDIADDYRLECVKPECPANIDLHMECRGWNTPRNHDHAVHQVPNK